MLALTLVAILGAELAAPVTGAVVYGGQARLTRTSEVTVPGRERLELPLLPREADPDSVRVEVTGAELDTVEVARLGPLSLRVDEARKVVEALERLDGDLALASAEEAALATAAGLADEAPEVPGDDSRVWGSLDPARWRQTLTFLRGWREGLDRRRGGLAARIELLRSQRAGLAERAATLAAGDEGRVRVVVHVSGHGPARVRTSYLLTGPSWNPRYEVRLDSNRDEVEVSLAALAAQETGEDWQHATLTFSTALPLVSTAAPELPRWTIGERARFIPDPVAQVEPDGTVAPPVVPAPPAELTALRARLEALARPIAGDKPREAGVIRASAAYEVQTAGHGASAPARPKTETFTAHGFDTKASPTGGGMVGYAFDQNGIPIMGVKISVAAPAARMVAYTNGEGLFRLPLLPLGTYELRATAPRLKTYVQKDLRVGPQGAEINVVMEAASTDVEEVRVIERAPTINTTSAHIKESYDDQFVSARSYESASQSQARRTISLAPPGTERRRSSLPLGLAMALGGGHDLSFDAVAPETLLSGSMAQRVPLGTWRWPVAVRRQLFPAVRPDAYLVANLRSPAPEPLPAGEAALFLDGQPVGHAHLELIRPRQAFTLPLGIDRAVRARRQVELDSHERGLINKDDVNRYVVTIDVANPHRQGVALDVFDQLPQAGDDSVQVKLESSDPPVKVDDKGLLTWHTGLAAGTTLRLRFVYTLTRPKGHRLHQ